MAERFVVHNRLKQWIFFMTALIAPASGSCAPVIQPLFNVASFLSSDGEMYGGKKTTGTHSDEFSGH